MLVSISVAARMCGVCPKTLRRWDAQGKITPSRTLGNHRRYSRSALYQFLTTGIYRIPKDLKTGIAAVYSRVSAAKQKKDLHTQTHVLQDRAIADGYTPKIYSDIGSGLNDHRPRFLRMLVDAVHKRFDCIYITFRDRFARFGTHSYETVFQSVGIPICCLHDNTETGLETRLVEDVLAVITSFAGKLHRARRGKIGKVKE